MSIAQRKSRELQIREELILDHAQALLEEHGYLGLNLDALAERVEYSKGTLYLHFHSKEDLILGVCLRMIRERLQLFRHAVRYPGRTREKFAALGIADLLLAEQQPNAFSVMQLVSTPSVWEKTSESRQKKLIESTRDIGESVIGVVREALLNGDIEKRQTDPLQILNGIMAMSKGAMLIGSSPHCFGPEFSSSAMSFLQKNRHRYLDGFGWKLLSDDFDYETLETKLREEYFHDFEFTP